MKISEFIANHCTVIDYSNINRKYISLADWIKANPISDFGRYINHNYIQEAIKSIENDWALYAYNLYGSRHTIRVKITSNNTGTPTDRTWDIGFIPNNGICTEAKVTYNNKTIICITDDFDKMIAALSKHCKDLEGKHKRILDNKAKNTGNIPHMILQELRDFAKDKFKIEYNPKSSSPYIRISEQNVDYTGNCGVSQYQISVLFKELEATIKVFESGVLILKDIINLADRGEDPDGFKNIVTLLSETLPNIRKKYMEEINKIKLSDLLKG
jgi:hypothetical protein